MPNDWSANNSTGTTNMGIWGEESVTVKKVTTISPDIKPPQTPRNGINRMMANVKNSNLFSRPYLYYIFITPPKTFTSKTILDGIMLNCEAVSIPGHVLATKEHKTYGLKREYVYEKLYELVTMSFYMSDQMHEFNFFNAWLNSMYINGRVSYYNDYKGTIEIYQCSGIKNGDGEDLEVMMKVKLIDAYPKTISALPLGHGLTNTIQRMSTNITYRDVEYTDYTKQDPTKQTQDPYIELKQRKITSIPIKSVYEKRVAAWDKANEDEW
jgi:hypothetical protein